MSAADPQDRPNLASNQHRDTSQARPAQFAPQKPAASGQTQPQTGGTSDLKASQQPAPSEESARLARSLRNAQSLYNKSRRRFHDFVLAASDWVWETDHNGTITFISDRITEVMGKPPSRMIGENILTIGTEFGPGTRLSETMTMRRPFRTVALEIADAQGKRRFCRLSGIPAFDDQTGRFTGYRGAGTDCTAQVEAEAAAARSQAKLKRLIDEVATKNDHLKMALESAEAAVHAKSEFLANVSHELRTPLNAIIGFTEIMELQMYGPLGDERYHGYTQHVLQSSHHLLSIINDLLDMAKVEAGKLELSERTIDVAPLAESCLALLRERMTRGSLSLTVLMPTGGPLLWADERLLKQMLINLLDNAVKFTPEGGTISLQAQIADNGGYSITVSDTGIGIAPEDIKRVLEPFGQIETATSRSHNGTGLGLPLVDAMVKLHGGSLEVESQVGQGTSITLRFPPERTISQPANLPR